MPLLQNPLFNVQGMNTCQPVMFYLQHWAAVFFLAGNKASSVPGRKVGFGAAVKRFSPYPDRQAIASRSFCWCNATVSSM